MIPYMEYGSEEQTPEQTQLYETCLKGSKDEIRKYCQQENTARQFLKDGLNPIHVVAIAGRKDAEIILDMMLQNGFDVNVQTRSNDDTVLHLIVEQMDVKEAFPLVLKILEYGPDLSLRNRRLRTPYDIALARGEVELAQVLSGSMTAEEAREFYTKKISFLYGGKLVDAVIRSNETDILDFLRLGADPNHVNEHKNGAIHYAITHCTLPIQKTLQILIDGGADVNLRDDEGDTALNLVIKMTKLRDTGDMYKCVELLLKHGALSTFKDLDGNDALALAKKRQYADIVKLLTEARQGHIQKTDNKRKKEPSVPSPRQEPPVIDTPVTRRFSFQQDVLEEEQDDDFDEEEVTPPPMNPQDHLVRAIREGTLEEVNEALFDLRANPDIPGDDGIYPIHHVLIRGEMEDEDERIEMLKSLIEAGADVNMKTVNSESTPLHVAATKNQDVAAQVLLDTHKCDYNLKNKHGKTAYDVAEEEECQEVMDVIENHRKKVRQKMQKAAKASICSIL